MLGRDIPKRIGPYRIEDRLGGGGMGEVYRAYHERLHRSVALKQIRPDVEDRPSARERFQREAQAAAQLNHPSIVQIYDIIEEHGCDWIIMELVEGQPLGRLLDEGPPDVARALALITEIADGLAAAHAKSIVHRDLKVENVVVTLTGHAKILDFGLAKELQPGMTDSSLTHEGQVLGTPRTMSPEQILGRKVDHRCDLFALGTLSYEAP